MYTVLKTETKAKTIELKKANNGAYIQNCVGLYENLTDFYIAIKLKLFDLEFSLNNRRQKSLGHFDKSGLFNVVRQFGHLVSRNDPSPPPPP